MILLNKHIHYTLFFFVILTIWGCTKDEPSSLQKDEFIKGFGGAFKNQAIDIIQDNGSFYLLGNELSRDNKSNIVVVKTDELGNRIWEKSYNKEDKQILGNQLIKLNKQNGFAIIGAIEMDTDSLYYDVFLLIIDKNGDVILDKNYNFLHSEYGKCIAELYDGGFVIATSQSTSNNTNFDNSLFTRLTPQGDIVLNGTSNMPSNNIFNMYKSDKGFYVTSYNNLTPEIVMLNADGTLIAPMKFSNIDGKIFGITQDADENTFICGEINSGTNGGVDGFIAKLTNINESFEYEWLKEFGDSKNDYLNNINITKDNNILVAGSIENTISTSDIWVLKTNIGGELISQSIIGGTDNEYGVKVSGEDNNRFIVLGTTHFEGSSLISIYKSELE